MQNFLGTKTSHTSGGDVTCSLEWSSDIEIQIQWQNTQFMLIFYKEISDFFSSSKLK